MSLLRRVRWGALACALALLVWAALAPLRYPTRERNFDFPSGAALLARQHSHSDGDGMRGLVPSAVRLTLGVRDVLLLRNRDVVSHVFGQVSVLPGHLLRLPFEQAGDFVFVCDVALDHAVTVHVAEHPPPGWARLRWRLLALADGLRALPVQGPED